MGSTTLVVGGSGMLGEPVARRLAAEGHQVRILSRNPERTRAKLGDRFEYVQGDVEDADSLRRALEGCSGVHVNLMGGPRAEDFDRVEHLGTKRIADLAAQSNVERLTYLSGAPVAGEHWEDPATKAKSLAEKAIQQSGVPYSIFRVTWLMESLELFIRGKNAIIIGTQAHPVRWVAADDYAKLVARAYELPEAANKTFFVVGPEGYGKGDAMRIYIEIARPELKLRFMPVWLMKTIAALSFDRQLFADVGRMAFYDTIGDDFGDPSESHRILGMPTTTLRQWCERQAAKRR
ncbi:MAG: SDR family NAD(P)-dependent oxidoreductase [Myxococcales bacterium]|nr:SDR family NAD(P)-dependent oxidoreductase [Myxococcales bacterium]MDH3484866.1 SDR family NAD(P)-dependent oxidoreductase [Myxococcales bacterium]